MKGLICKWFLPFLMILSLTFIGSLGLKGGDVKADDQIKLTGSATTILVTVPSYKTKDGKTIGCLEFGPADNPERWVDCNDIFDSERMTLGIPGEILGLEGTSLRMLEPRKSGRILRSNILMSSPEFTITREKFHCPLCGEKGKKLGWIAVGQGDQWFSNCAWISSMDLYACPKCHLLFWEESKK